MKGKPILQTQYANLFGWVQPVKNLTVQGLIPLDVVIQIVLSWTKDYHAGKYFNAVDGMVCQKQKRNKVLQSRNSPRAAVPV